MKLFLDSAHLHEIAYALEMWNIDGVTTNPRHIQASGKPFLRVIQEIGQLFSGTDKPISVEVSPHHTIYQDMVTEGQRLAALCPNFVIKLPATEAGFKATALLKEKGIRSNVTLVFSPAQALMAMRMGADYVSSFIGWKEVNGENAVGMLEEIVAMRDRYGYNTRIIVAAVRDGRKVVEAALAGADIVTAGLDVLREAFDHPYTRVGLAKFAGYWAQTMYEE